MICPNIVDVGLARQSLFCLEQSGCRVFSGGRRTAGQSRREMTGSRSDFCSPPYRIDRHGLTYPGSWTASGPVGVHVTTNIASLPSEAGAHGPAGRQPGVRHTRRERKQSRVPCKFCRDRPGETPHARTQRRFGLIAPFGTRPFTHIGKSVPAMGSRPRTHGRIGVPGFACVRQLLPVATGELSQVIHVE